MRKLLLPGLGLLLFSPGCSGKPKGTVSTTPSSPSFFRVDPAEAGSVHGFVRYTGHRTPPRLVDLSADPACAALHTRRSFEDSLLVTPKGLVANAFVYIDKGLEGKTFAAPSAPVIMDQRGCWFRPHVLGIQTGQVLQVINSDPVTHNIHPVAAINREWNHSQGPGDPPLSRRFARREIMVPVKCNIHGWMHAFLGILEHPYFSVTPDDGSFSIPDLPPGTYTLSIWHEKLGRQSQQITVTAHHITEVELLFKAGQ